MILWFTCTIALKLSVKLLFLLCLTVFQGNYFQFQDCMQSNKLSEFHGNFLYKGLNLLDPILASIELSRRGYEFNAQYIEKTKEKSKTIVQLSLTKFDDLISKSLEEFGIKENFKNLIELYYMFQKDPKMMYRVPFAKDSKWSKFKNRKSQLSRLDVSLYSLRF